MKALFVRAEWDDEAAVWVATSDDVPGLATEAETVEALMSKLEVMIPELLDANEGFEGNDVPFELLTRRFQTVRRQGRDGQ
jgi:predicted RNase H-like HicB family nuclease